MSELVKTKRAALELSILLWEGLAETGNRKHTQIKSDWQLSGFEYFHQWCPLCEYTKENTSSLPQCKLCPVKWSISYAPYSIETPCPCQREASVYAKWEECCNMKERKPWARKVVKLLRYTLKELP